MKIVKALLSVFVVAGIAFVVKKFFINKPKLPLDHSDFCC